MLKKLSYFLIILIITLGISSVCYAKSMTTTDFESLLNDAGYEFGELSDYTIDVGSLEGSYSFKNLLNNSYSKFLIRDFNTSDGSLNKDIIYFSTYKTDIRMGFYLNNNKYSLYNYNTSTKTTIRYLFKIDITNKTISALEGNDAYITSYYMDYNNWTKIDTEVFSSDDVKRIIMKNHFIYADGNITNAPTTYYEYLNPRTSMSITNSTYEDINYTAVITPYFVGSSEWYFDFSEGWDLTKDYPFILELYSVKNDGQEIELASTVALKSHNSTKAENGYFGFSNKDSSTTFPLGEKFEIKFDEYNIDFNTYKVGRITLKAVDGNLLEEGTIVDLATSDLIVFDKNLIYDEGYFQFDYKYISCFYNINDETDNPGTPINPSDQDNSENPGSSNDNTSTDKDYTDVINGLGDKLDNISNAINETKTNMFSWLWDFFSKVIDWLFKPSENEIKDLINDLTSNDVVSDSVLGIPLNLMARFLNLFTTANYSDFKIEWPDWNLKLKDTDEITIIKSGSFNITELSESNETFKKMYNIYLIFINISASLGLIWWGVGFFKDILGLSTDISSANWGDDIALDGSSPTDDETVESLRRYYYANYSGKKPSATKDYYRSVLRKIDRGVYYGNKGKGKK